jgi:hypothetical protein
VTRVSLLAVHFALSFLYVMDDLLLVGVRQWMVIIGIFYTGVGFRFSGGLEGGFRIGLLEGRCIAQR